MMHVNTLQQQHHSAGPSQHHMGMPPDYHQMGYGTAGGPRVGFPSGGPQFRPGSAPGTPTAPWGSPRPIPGGSPQFGSPRVQQQYSTGGGRVGGPGSVGGGPASVGGGPGSVGGGPPSVGPAAVQSPKILQKHKTAPPSVPAPAAPTAANSYNVEQMSSDSSSSSSSESPD